MAIHVDLKSDDGVKEFLAKWRTLYENYCDWGSNLAGPDANARDMDKGLMGFLLSRVASLEIVISLLMEKVEGDAFSARLSEILELDEHPSLGFSAFRKAQSSPNLTDMLIASLREGLKDGSLLKNLKHKFGDEFDATVIKVNPDGQWEFLLVLDNDGNEGHVCAPRMMTMDQILNDLEENGHGSWNGDIEDCPNNEDRFHVHLSPKIAQYD
ncbi:hypothetical protein LCGC14_1397780 [marine sediment metagenome]|uniref:Uncharacterized protein n=1 Tax=marine sediment metagenome TaxID=412755 RepID=A0A0F9JY70_9ZZZZ